MHRTMNELAHTPLRVLVVDDCPDTTGSCAALLKIWKYDVRVAADGRAAVVIAQDYQPHVVLLDIGLPGMNGFDVARRFRDLPDLGWGVRIICISGYGQEADRRRSREVGCDYFFIKPIDPEHLQKLLEAEQARLRKQRAVRVQA
jgi:two-component system OmpR family response regulator